MPFGAIFGSLFLLMLAVWLMGGADHLPIAPRLFLALAGLSLAAGLLLRRGWARWAGVGFTVAVVLLMMRWIAIEPGVAPLVFLIGAVATAALLIVPATGSPDRKENAASPLVGRTVVTLAAVGMLGFVGSHYAWLRVGPSRGAGTDEGVVADARPANQRGNTRIAWNDFGTGMEQAVAQDRPMMVLFVTSWCGYCKKMDRTTFKDPAVVDRLSRLVTVRVDTEEKQARNGYRGVQLASEFGIRGTPTVALLGPQGKLLARQSGYLDGRDFLDWLDGALPARGRSPSDVLSISTP